jgi:hypothetical protein
MLGGVIHGFKLPISGLVVGSGAIVCIALIGYYVPAKGAIIKATFIVAIFKVMLSPQAPPQAYIAVFFQGVLGELLFMKRSWFKFSCMLLAILAMLESALQRIIVLTVLYGTSFWKGVDQFISNLVGQKSITRYSILVAGAYVLLHLLAGILLGWFTAMLPSRVRTSKNDEQFLMKGDNTTEDLLPSNKKRKTSIKTGLLIVWLILIALYIRSVMPFGKTLPPAQLPVHAFIRSILMVCGTIVNETLAAHTQKEAGKMEGRDTTDIGDTAACTFHNSFFMEFIFENERAASHQFIL